LRSAIEANGGTSFAGARVRPIKGFVGSHEFLLQLFYARLNKKNTPFSVAGLVLRFCGLPLVCLLKSNGWFFLIGCGSRGGGPDVFGADGAALKRHKQQH
jgi:hypothetical protein